MGDVSIDMTSADGKTSSQLAAEAYRAAGLAGPDPETATPAAWAKWIVESEQRTGPATTDHEGDDECQMT